MAVPATTATATRSPTSPAPSATIRHGISCTNARDNPTNRSPKLGDSRRANATTDPTERATSRGATTSREQRSASVARACPADAAPFTRSNAATSSTRSRSDNEAASTPASHARNPSTTPTAPPTPPGTTASTGVAEPGRSTAEPESTTRSVRCSRLIR